MRCLIILKHGKTIFVLEHGELDLSIADRAAATVAGVVITVVPVAGLALVIAYCFTKWMRVFFGRAVV
jgi:hypothetical protein